MNEKKINENIEKSFAAFGRGVGLFLKTVFFGAKQLMKIPYLIGFFVSVGITAAAYSQQQRIFALSAPVYIQYALYWVLLLAPGWYLFILGNRQRQNAKVFRGIFQSINFTSKDKKYPIFLFARDEGKTEVFGFKSNIPLDRWIRDQAALETAMDCNIIRIEEMGSKKKVKVTTISTDVKIPTNIRWNDQYIDYKDGQIVIGEDAAEQISFNLNKFPHVLFAGQTGSGKSVALRTALWQCLKKGAVAFMVDFKGGVEFGLQYEQYGKVIVTKEEAIRILELLVKENEKRLLKFRQMQVKNLKEYNQKMREEREEENARLKRENQQERIQEYTDLSRIIVVLDEIAEMMDTTGATKEEKELMQQIQGYLSTLARLSRATGINLFIGAQRPDAKILPGQIKNNVPVRICGMFADDAPSEIVLGNTKATRLPEIPGRMLFQITDTIEFQAYYFDDDTMLKSLDDMEYSVILPQILKEAHAGRPERLAEPQGSEIVDRPRKKNVEPQGAINLNFNFDE